MEKWSAFLYWSSPHCSPLCHLTLTLSILLAHVFKSLSFSPLKDTLLSATYYTDPLEGP